MMNRIRVLPRNTIIIEDSIPGLRSALSSGAHVIAMTGSVTIDELNIAHRIVSHHDEITVKFIEDLLHEKL